MPSPVSTEGHAGPHFDLITWLGFYRTFTPGIQGGDNGTLRLNLSSAPQPDAFLRILPSHGGNSKTDADGYVVGAPELIAEVAASNASYDLHDKLDAYLRNSVQEYVVWRVWDQAIDWFVRRGDRYEPLPRPADQPYQSEVFPGLWLAPDALIKGDLARVFQVVQQGIASPAHAQFAQRLQQAAGQAP